MPSIDNDAPAKGATVKTTFAFDLDAPITGGTAYYSATLNGLGPYTSQEALCDATAKSNDPCPLGVGAHNQVSSTQNTLSGKIVTTVEWYDDAGARILVSHRPSAARARRRRSPLRSQSEAPLKSRASLILCPPPCPRPHLAPAVRRAHDQERVSNARGERRAAFSVSFGFRFAYIQSFDHCADLDTFAARTSSIKRRRPSRP